MIRKLLNGDIDRVADIWLKTNLKAHYFISNQYWKSNYELVKEMLSQSEVYVFEADKMIQGFVGLNDEYIYDIVKTYSENTLGKFSKHDALVACPSLGSSSVESALKKLVDEGNVIRTGAGRKKMYMMKKE